MKRTGATVEGWSWSGAPQEPHSPSVLSNTQPGAIRKDLSASQPPSPPRLTSGQAGPGHGQGGLCREGDYRVTPATPCEACGALRVQGCWVTHERSLWQTLRKHRLETTLPDQEPPKRGGPFSWMSKESAGLPVLPLMAIKHFS